MLGAFSALGGEGRRADEAYPLPVTIIFRMTACARLTDLIPVMRASDKQSPSTPESHSAARSENKDDFLREDTLEQGHAGNLSGLWVTRLG